MPEPRKQEIAAPAVATQAPAPSPEAPKKKILSDAESAALAERMFVESAPLDPSVANAYAEAETEEGGLTGFVLRLVKQQ